MANYVLMKKGFFVLIYFISFSTMLFAQKQFERKISREQYIELYKNDAIKGMHESGVPASITLAQGILESGDGNSPLAVKANNHFGIKCHSDWEGKTFKQDDDAKNECFRKYHSVYDSFKDHADFLSTRKRYAFLFEYDVTDYKKWAHGLKQAGYATNPKYPALLIKIIEENNLAQYDKMQYHSEEEIVADKKESKSQKTNKQEVIKEEKNIPTVASSTNVKLSDNNIKYVIAKKGDSYFKIAEENQMGLWQILKYNDLEKNQQPKPGDVVYLQPKRSKSKVAAHRVKPGETAWDVSQTYGVKLDIVYKKNNLNQYSKLSPGTVLTLR